MAKYDEIILCYLYKKRRCEQFTMGSFSIRDLMKYDKEICVTEIPSTMSNTNNAKQIEKGLDMTHVK